MNRNASGRGCGAAGERPDRGRFNLGNGDPNEVSRGEGQAIAPPRGIEGA